LKQYLVFNGLDYYPSAGIGDYERSFSSIKAAKAYAKTITQDPAFFYAWVQIVDGHTEPPCILFEWSSLKDAERDCE